LSSDGEPGDLDEGYDGLKGQAAKDHYQIPNRIEVTSQQEKQSIGSGARVMRMSAAGRGPLPAGSAQRSQMNMSTNTVEEPICVLKIELDGEHIEEIKVFENDDPNEIVQKFGNDFNLSQNARQRLLEQIQEQIQMDDD